MPPTPPPLPRPSPPTAALADSQINDLAEFKGFAVVIGLAAGAVVLLLLLSFCLRRRWLRSRAPGQIEKDVNDAEMEAASEQGVVDAGVEPRERRSPSSFKQDRIEGLPFPPMGLRRTGTSNRVLSSRARKTAHGAEESVEPWPQAFFASRRLTDPRPEILDTGVKPPLEQDLIKSMPRPPGLPDPSIMSQGKLTEDVDAAPTDKAARFRARKASITEGDEFYEGAKGTKEGPGRCVSRSSRSMRAGAFASGGITMMTPIATSEAVMATSIRSGLNYDAGSGGSSSGKTSRSSESSGQTEHTARDQRVPNPPARKPDDIWAAVRARRATSAAFNSDRRQRLQAMRQEQARLSCHQHAPTSRKHSPVGGTVRV